MMMSMVKITIRIPIYKIKKYIKENLGAPFIVIFQGLLILCAGLMIIDNSKSANFVAIIAYFFLTIGVCLNFYFHSKDREYIE